jgi:hypothetical protein
MAMEFYMGHNHGDSIFRDCTVTNVKGALVIVGGLTNNTRPTYSISNNIFAEMDDFGILPSPAPRMTVRNNRFYGGYRGFTTDGSAKQGNDLNHDIVIEGNQFHGTYQCLYLSGGPNENIMVRSNTAVGCRVFANGCGWNTNVTLTGNRSLTADGVEGGGPFGIYMQGQYYLDDGTNEFPPPRVGDTVGRTNIITYALGVRQRIYTERSNSVYMIDDSCPGKVPPGATLQIEHDGLQFYSVPLYFSNTDPNAGSVIMRQGDVIRCRWSNGRWERMP